MSTSEQPNGRRADVNRETTETQIALSLDLDGSGRYAVESPVGFLNHMLELFARHGAFDLTVKAAGDTHVDDHHLVEDVGICLGQAFDKALGDKAGITRYGNATVPMDEALVTCDLDLSGRPFLAFSLRCEKPKVGTFDVELCEEFFRAFAMNARLTLHVRQHSGANCHHLIEAAFKATARALRTAVACAPGTSGVPSTKGVL